MLSAMVIVTISVFVAGYLCGKMDRTSYRLRIVASPRSRRATVRPLDDWSNVVRIIDRRSSKVRSNNG